MTHNEKSALLGLTIQTNAATARGFDVTDCPEGGTRKAAHQRCRLMIERGELFKARANYRLIRYFLTAADANKFISDNMACETAKLAPSMNFSQKQYARRTDNKQKAAVVATEPIHTVHTIYSSRMMEDRFAVSVPFVRIGQPGWSMSVGASL